MTEWKQRELEFRTYIPKGNFESYGGEDRRNYYSTNKVTINCHSAIYTLPERLDVIPLIVTVQYTGVEDINTKKMFEADIVNITTADFIGVGIVMFEDGRFLIYHPDKGKLEISFLQEKDIQILGNVFQNPELVKKYGLEF